MPIQWFPGHMASARKKAAEAMASTDVVIEVTDARLPEASSNPMIAELRRFRNRPCLKLLNKSDLADPAVTRMWMDFYNRQPGVKAVAISAKSAAEVARIPSLCSQLAPHRDDGVKPLRMMIMGIPNVGKSTFINKVSGRKTAKAEDRPGVTRGKQWVPVDKTLELLDTPGILWPKFEDPDVGVRLGFTGAIRDDVMDMEDLASRLMAYLGAHYPEALTERYKITVEPGEQGWELLEKAGRKRGFLMSGGEVNTERMARILLDEYRAGKLGRFTLELPEENA